MSSRFERAYRVDGTTTFDADFWNRIMRDLDTRIVGIEEKKASFEEAEKTLLDLGLRRINETLLPTAERIFRVAELGFLIASSDEEATFVEGQNASLTIREGDQRDLFTPSPFIALTRRSTSEDYAIARTIAYDPETGVLLFEVETVIGDGGPYDDWDVAALAGSVAAMVASLDETRALRQAVADDKSDVTQLKADTIAEKEAAQAARAGAQDARTGAENAKTGAENALASFLTIYRGAHARAPSNGEQGHFYFDTSLQQARVYTAAGWAPLFTVSLGGIRQDTIEAEEAQTVFTVDGGGFTFINVFKNGVLLVPGVDYTTASPDFTLATGAEEGDQISYLAYYATEQTDFYTKEIADGRFVRHDGTQELTPAQKGQALANIDAQQRLDNVSFFELGQNLSGDRHCYLDMHASDGVDYSARIIREAGINGLLDIINTGSGGILANGSPIVTDARMPGSLSGYQQFQNGIILQWGRTETATNANGNAPVVYPVAFPNAPLLFIPINGNQEMPADPAVSVGTSQDMMVNPSLAYASFRPNPGDAVPVVVNWIALGY